MPGPAPVPAFFGAAAPGKTQKPAWLGGSRFLLWPSANRPTSTSFIPPPTNKRLSTPGLCDTDIRIQTISSIRYISPADTETHARLCQLKSKISRHLVSLPLLSPPLPPLSAHNSAMRTRKGHQSDWHALRPTVYLVARRKNSRAAKYRSVSDQANQMTQTPSRRPTTTLGNPSKPRTTFTSAFNVSNIRRYHHSSAVWLTEAHRAQWS
jgi:hypothetical protein